MDMGEWQDMGWVGVVELMGATGEWEQVLVVGRWDGEESRDMVESDD